MVLLHRVWQAVQVLQQAVELIEDTSNTEGHRQALVGPTTQTFVPLPCHDGSPLLLFPPLHSLTDLDSPLLLK
jgi:hypothetical protein